MSSPDVEAALVAEATDEADDDTDDGDEAAESLPLLFTLSPTSSGVKPIGTESVGRAIETDDANAGERRGIRFGVTIGDDWSEKADEDPDVASVLSSASSCKRERVPRRRFDALGLDLQLPRRRRFDFGANAEELLVARVVGAAADGDDGELLVVRGRLGGRSSPELPTGRVSKKNKNTFRKYS